MPQRRALVPAMPFPRRLRWLTAILFVTMAAGVYGQSPQAAPAQLRFSPRAWADAAAANQSQILKHSPGVPLTYRVRRVNERGDTTREIINSQDGPVARILERDGRPLTKDEDAAERARLTSLLQFPDVYRRRHRHDNAEQSYVLELLQSLPPSMLWRYAPGQPPLPGVAAPQVVLDFTPDPNFKPPSLVTEALTGIAGRVWIDAQSRCVLRIEGHILHTVNLGWGGMLVRINAGGTVELQQQPVGDSWFYSQLGEHLTVREVLVHTVTENTQVHAWDARILPQPVSLEDAIRQLLALPVPTRTGN